MGNRNLEGPLSKAESVTMGLWAGGSYRGAGSSSVYARRQSCQKLLRPLGGKGQGWMWLSLPRVLSSRRESVSRPHTDHHQGRSHTGTRVL